MPHKTHQQVRREEAERISSLIGKWLKDYHSDPWSFPSMSQKSWAEGFADYVVEKILEEK